MNYSTTISPASLPIILIGGPPNSGKSVLVYNLSQHLRNNNIPHYVLRASSDGEGDWFNSSDPNLAQYLRSKGNFNENLVENVVKDIKNRQFPLLVDMGGLPSQLDKEIFEQGTHAILLISDANYFEELQKWKNLIDIHSITCLAIIKSSLAISEPILEKSNQMLTGTIGGLERGKSISNIVIDALSSLISQIITELIAPRNLEKFHLENSPSQKILNLEELALEIIGERFWTPNKLDTLFHYLDIHDNQDIAIYGRAPNWLFLAIALSRPSNSIVWLFDARLGWVHPPVIENVPQKRSNNIQVLISEKQTFTLVEFRTRNEYIRIEDPEMLREFFLKDLPSTEGLIFSGKLPNWLNIAIAHTLVDRFMWLGHFQPSLQGAVIVTSQKPELKPGSIISISIEDFQE